MPTIPIDTNSSGFVVASPGAKQVCVILGLDLTAADTVVVSLKAGSKTIWKTYAMSDPTVLGGIVLNIDENRDLGLFDTSGDPIPAGAQVTLVLDGAVAVAGSITFRISGPTFPGQAG